MALIKNTLGLGLLIVVYYMTLLLMSWIFAIFDTVPILNTWRAAWGDPSWIFWQFFLYLGIPIIIVIAFITTTKPETEEQYLRRRF